MSIEYSGDELDALVAYLNDVITEANVSPDSELLKIARIAKNYAFQANQNELYHSAFLRDLVELCHAKSQWKQSLLPVVRTSDGKPVTLGKRLGAGAEGSVYKLPTFPGKVAKIYHADKTIEERRTREQKLRYLLSKKDVVKINQALIAALPEHLLYYSDGSLAGYIMPQFLTTTKLCEVPRTSHIRKLLPELDYRGLIAIAYNLAEVVHLMHSHDIVIGDLNPNNILVQADGTIGLIDTDSFDVTVPDSGEHFRCVVGMPELLAPELQAVGSPKAMRFTKESDCFSLAIHIFRLLMNNADPFGFKIADDDISAMRIYSADLASPQNQIINGESPYFRDIPGREIPAWAPEVNLLPEKIQQLFRRTFGYTSQTISKSISQRPTAAEWMDALLEFYRMPLQQCGRDAFHLYLPSLPECPFCKDIGSIHTLREIPLFL